MMRRLYEEVARNLDPAYLEFVEAVAVGKYGTPPSGITVTEWVMSNGNTEDGVFIDILTLAAFSTWRTNGCPVFSLDEKSVDLFACTAPTPMRDIPYRSFAVEFPYPIALPGEVGGSFRSVIAFKAAGYVEYPWLLVFRSSVQKKGVTLMTGVSAINAILSNLMQYTAQGGERKSSPSLRSHTRPARKAGVPVNVWRVSPRLKTPLPLGMAREFLASGEAPPKTFKIGKRFMVRGHWRNQACGKGLSDRRMKWIYPYIKGPEDAEAWSRVYEVKT